jgi:hypothetical protein
MAVVDYVVGTARLGWPGAGDSWWERSGISQRRLVYDLDADTRQRPAISRGTRRTRPLWLPLGGVDPGPKRAEMAGG